WASSQDPLQSPWIRPGDSEIITQIKQRGTPCLLAINKVDLTKDKSQLLPMLEAYSRVHEFSAIVPTSLRRDSGITALLDGIAARLPEGPAVYDADTLTNRP